MASEKSGLVFFDASILVAAARSPLGGSALSLEVCGGQRFRGAVTARVLTEARVNIAEKFGDVELVRFYQQLAATSPEIVSPPFQERLHQSTPLTSDKDAHVLAAALECEADYLLTLDRRHLLTPLVLEAGLPVQVMTPGEFLRRMVPEQ